MKRLIKTLFLSLVLSVQLFAHSGKPKYHVIIDTDGAIDDMRSISMFLSDNEVRVLAISCSQGVLMPNSVYDKVSSLLSAYHHEGIPVGVSDTISFKPPAFAAFAQSIDWGNHLKNNHLKPHQNSIHLLNTCVENNNNKLTLIALGSLKTYADWLLSNPEIVDKIERIIWYNNQITEKGFNYKISPESFSAIKKAGIPITIVSNTSNNLIVNTSYLNTIRNSQSIYAQQIANVHEQPIVTEKVKQRHLQLWDDLVPLYLVVPILFETKTNEGIEYASLLNTLPNSFVYETIGDVLVSGTKTNNRVFINFPVDSTLYQGKYSKIITSTLKTYGSIEWKAIVMTNEIHGHTGIYSIIGAKMGIRALEYFNVGVNNLKALSYAGNKPPLSCFNDGLQISTGATIGQGLITISDSISALPSAIFECNQQKVKISVTPQIAEQMQNEIKYGIQSYGLLTEKYWLYIEELAIKYWSTFNRNDIFIIEDM
ncbi:MAG: nucleoside hydrolase [Salinivirgaceae bacterium]|nr:nucleoside hydrolase [Salinivirgaceae bacterium]